MADALAWLGTAGGILGGAAAAYTAVRVRSIERYRAKLRSEGYEHEVRFGRLHEKRVEIIADLYRKLVDAEAAFASWVSPLQEAGEHPMTEKAQRAADAGSEFRMSFLRNRIWLDRDLCDQIGAFDRKLYETFVKFTTYHPDDPLTKKEYLEGWMKAWKTVSEQVPSLRDQIEERFRKMLGVIGPP
jgi:hypothetical protein